MPRKVFTAGEVLAAADVNEFLADQAIMTFADSTARGSAIPSPIEGMVTYLEDVNLYENYNGTSFESLANNSGAGLIHIKKVAFSAVASQQITDVFSTKYQNYKILINVFGTTATALRFRLRAVSDADGANYNFMFNIFSGSTLGVATQNNETSYRPGDIRATTRSNFVIETFSPFKSTKTGFLGFGQRTDGIQLTIDPAEHQLTDSFTGFTIFPETGTITGEVYVYGYKE
jgi:hypothetical protein